VVKIDGSISGVQVLELSALQHLSDHKISGELDGDFAYTDTGPNRSLTGKLTLSDSRVELGTPVFNQKSLDFRDIDADLVLNNRTLTIKQCIAKGNQLDVNLSGTIVLNGGPAKNALNLTASVIPHHGFLAKIGKNLPIDFLQKKKAGTAAISFKIDGTLDEPGFSLN